MGGTPPGVWGANLRTDSWLCCDFEGGGVRVAHTPSSRSLAELTLGHWLMGAPQLPGRLVGLSWHRAGERSFASGSEEGGSNQLCGLGHAITLAESWSSPPGPYLIRGLRDRRWSRRGKGPQGHRTAAVAIFQWHGHSSPSYQLGAQCRCTLAEAQLCSPGSWRH